MRTTTLTATQEALVLTMEAIVRLHDEEHDYLSECECIDAYCFRRADTALKAEGINFAHLHTNQG